jgi:hypothetical protein
MTTAEMDAPAATAVAVTASDNTDIPRTRGLYVGTSGNARLTLIGMADGANVLFTGLAGGAIYPFRVKRVWSTDLTAGSIVALY